MKLDEIGRVMHEAWSTTKRAQGFHGPDDKCSQIIQPEPGPTIRCGQEYMFFTGVIGHPRCTRFHADLIPWEQLPEKQKDINRHAADALLARGVLVTRAQADAAVSTALESVVYEAECWGLGNAIVRDIANHIRRLITQPQRDALAAGAAQHSSTDALERAQASVGAFKEQVLNEIRTGRTVTNFGHLPSVMRALEWILHDVGALPTNDAAFAALLARERLAGRLSAIREYVPHDDTCEVSRAVHRRSHCNKCYLESEIKQRIGQLEAGSTEGKEK